VHFRRDVGVDRSGQEKILYLTKDRIKTIFSPLLPCLQATAMNLKKAIKPISYLKSHTAEIFKNLEKNRG
jgi:hypothetical protein